KTVYYSPSGLLHRINLGAIQPARRETLADRYQLIGMGSTRNLVVPPAVSIAGNTAALFGGIQYEMDSTKIAAYLPPDTAGGNFVLRGSGGFVYTDSTLRGGAWSPLPATVKEIGAAGKILKNKGFQTSVYRDYAATEEALQKIGHAKSPSPRVLHIATHGFFFPDRNPQSVIRNRWNLYSKFPTTP
ncbi:MAG: CHAT domain-containing protein, partial [Thermoanaerobaculia bacterium]|nr:CHAT domain-containing protein [Thermoanaerobaculia bacterium]